MFYTIRHVTRYHYNPPVAESVMEVRARPRTELNQVCRRFELRTSPRAKLFEYRDGFGNTVEHFDIPARHARLAIASESLVEVVAPPKLPDALPASVWDVLAAAVDRGEFWEMLAPSFFARHTPALDQLARDLQFDRRREDPLTMLRSLTAGLFVAFEYAPQTTRVDSPIDHALELRRGVCQDFAHIMITMVRALRIPCRYVSGYLAHDALSHDRSAADASHAWVEAWLPDLGWVGLDPTNNLSATERYIRVAVGRDYADVPPTRGIFKGETESKLEVSVVIETSAAPVDLGASAALDWPTGVADEASAAAALVVKPPVDVVAHRQQQQQQQQQ